MQREPLPQLLHEVVRVFEQAIDQIDDLAVELVEAGRQSFADNSRACAAYSAAREGGNGALSPDQSVAAISPYSHPLASPRLSPSITPCWNGRDLPSSGKAS